MISRLFTYLILLIILVGMVVLFVYGVSRKSEGYAPRVIIRQNCSCHGR